jgi:hypothetical protein
MTDSDNQGFGRRKPAERQAYVSPAGTTASAKRGQTAGLDISSIPVAPVGGSSGALGGVLFGLAIVGCLIGGYVVMMKGFGRALDTHWRENVGYPGIEDAYKRTAGGDVSLERIHNDCKSRSDFVRLNRSRTQTFDGPGLDGLFGGEAALNQAAYYVSCLTGEQPERFCQQVHRTHLITALKDYYRLMGRARWMLSGNPFSAPRVFGGPSREAIPTTQTPSAQTDERVVAGLRTLLQGGYLSRRDLSPVMGAPGDLDIALKGVEPRRSGCA